MAKEFLHKHFINEAKAAINRWSNIGGSGGTTPAPGGIVEIDVFPERELIFWGDGNNIYTGYMEPMFELEAGQTYHVAVDGVSYTCVAEKNMREYDDGGRYEIYTSLGGSYDPYTGNMAYSHPFYIAVYRDVYEGSSYSSWYAVLPGSDDSGDPLPHTIRIYRECKAEEVTSISTEHTISTQTHDNGMIIHTKPLRFDIGWTYTVRIMDQTYECCCDIESEYGMIYLGNPLLAGLTPNEGDDLYPFFMANITMGDGSTAAGVMIDPNTFPVGEDIHVTGHFKNIGGVRLENVSIAEKGVYYPSEGYDGFAGIKVTASGASKAGLHAIYDDRRQLIMSWDKLTTLGYLNVGSGGLSIGASSLSDIIPTSEPCTIVLCLPDDGTVTTIASRAFEKVKETMTIDFGVFSPLNSIGEYAFRQCSNLKNIYFGNYSALESIGTSAFSGCSNLIGVDFGAGSRLHTIGEYAFSGCACLTSIRFPETVTSFEDCIFQNSGGLTSIGPIGSGADVEIPSSVTELSRNMFRGCTGLTSIELPATITCIEKHAFDGCTSLTSIVFPESPIAIRDNAFVNCTGLKEITFPAAIDSIQNLAFSYCTNLSIVTVLAETPPYCVSSSFTKCTSLSEIRVPAGSVDAYKADIGWRNYASKIVAIA